MPTWQEVATVTAQQRADWIAERKAQRGRGHRPANFGGYVIDGLDVIEARGCPADFDHPHLYGDEEGDRGVALEIAKCLCQIDADRGTLTAAEPAHADDNRKRNARLRALDTEAEHLGTQLQAATASWWPEQPPTRRTGARTAPKPGVNAPGPAPRAFVPR